MSTYRYFMLLMVAACLLVSGCERTSPQADRGPVTYRHSLDGAPNSLDPAHAADVYASTLVTNIFDTLYRYKYLARPYELTPNLAADFPEVSEDGLVYRIRLRPDARFADDPVFPDGHGRPVTASDVVYSLRRHFNPTTRSQGAWLWRGRIRGLNQDTPADEDVPIKGLEVLDEHTLRIELNAPYPQLIHTLAMALSAVVPREAVETYGREFGTHPVGSGPFRLVDLNETRAVLEPNPHFDRGPLDLSAEGYRRELHADYGLKPADGKSYPMIDRLEVHFITEPTTRWISFNTQREMDNVMVPMELAGRVLASREPIEFEPEIRRRYHTLAGQEAGFVFYGFNMANPEIGHNENPERERRNRALRCAMRDAFDWQARNDTFYHGIGQVFPGVIPPFVDPENAETDWSSTRHDLESARRRLAENGWTAEGLPVLRYGLESSVHQRQMFEQFRAQMMEAGIPADRFRRETYASFGEYNRAINQRELDIFLLGWTMAYPDAQYNLQLFYGPNAAPGANSSNYSNPEFDRLFERASKLPDGAERDAIYRRLNRLIVDDCVIIGSLARTRLHLWHKRVRMVPDRELTGGFFLRFVDMAEPGK